jgi:arylsulfatase
MAEQPNIILIISEQHRGDCLGIERHPVLQTPNLDSLAGAGVRFTRAYTSCPTCIAARRSILSGQFPETHGMVGYCDGVPWAHAPTTLPGALRAAGYHAVHIGRDMHQTPKRKRYGFDHMIINADYREWLEQQAPERGGFFGSGIRNNDFTACPWPLADYLHHTNWTVSRALEFLEKRDPSAPYFLNLSFYAAHPPLQPPAFYFERYLRTGVPEPAIGEWATPPPNDGLGVPNGGMSVDLKGEALLSARAGYYGLINHLDEQLRRVLNPFSGLLDMSNTIVMFVSDHGEMLGDHYRWHKAVAYEGAARIPFLVQAPERYGISPGGVIDDIVSLEDVMPTLLDMAGIEIPDSVEGKSLLPMMQQGGGAVREYLHIEHAPCQHCLTNGREKYIWHVADGREQFFDLSKDPNEMHDLGGTREARERVATWRQALVEELVDRPEGFSDGKRLIPGRPYPAMLPHAVPESGTIRS